jgi:hypothetical protein
MVRHDDEFVDRAGDPNHDPPCLFRNRVEPRIVEDAQALVCTGRHEIRAGRPVIKMGQPYRPAVMEVGAESHRGAIVAIAGEKRKRRMSPRGKPEARAHDRT